MRFLLIWMISRFNWRFVLFQVPFFFVKIMVVDWIIFHLDNFRVYTHPFFIFFLKICFYPQKMKLCPLTISKSCFRSFWFGLWWYICLILTLGRLVGGDKFQVPKSTAFFFFFSSYVNSYDWILRKPKLVLVIFELTCICLCDFVKFESCCLRFEDLLQIPPFFLIFSFPKSSKTYVTTLKCFVVL